MKLVYTHFRKPEKYKYWTKNKLKSSIIYYPERPMVKCFLSVLYKIEIQLFIRVYYLYFSLNIIPQSYLKKYNFECPSNIPFCIKWQPTPVFSPGESHGQRSLQSMGSQSQTRLKQLSKHSCIHYLNIPFVSYS